MGRSCQVSKQGLQKAKEAFKVKGWTQDHLAGRSNCSRAIVINFFAKRPVEMRLFQTICTELGLEWGDIAEFESESEQLSVTDKDKIIQEPSGTTQVLTDKKSYAFAIAGTVSPEDIAKLKAIIALIQKVSQDSSITIVDIERGSIKLILEGSQEGLERLENLFRSGQLEDVLGISVENVEFITLPNSTSYKNRLAFTIAGDVAESEIAILKAALIETSDDTVKRSQSQRLAFRGNPLRVNLIFKNLIRGNLGDVFRILKNLIRADLRGADLSGVNLSGVNLSGADLGDANLFAANLRDADLSAANLGDANLSLAKLGGANLSLANLSCAKLAGADLSNADLSDADLSDADLLDVKFGNAKLSIAMLGANLTRTNLSRANLSRANLCGAILTDAILESTIVINALFDGNIGLTEDMKRDLERRGAIFGDRPPVLSSK